MVINWNTNVLCRDVNPIQSYICERPGSWGDAFTEGRRSAAFALSARNLSNSEEEEEMSHWNHVFHTSVVCRNAACLQTIGNAIYRHTVQQLPYEEMHLWSLIAYLLGLESTGKSGKDKLSVFRLPPKVKKKAEDGTEHVIKPQAGTIIPQTPVKSEVKITSVCRCRWLKDVHRSDMSYKDWNSDKRKTGSYKTERGWGEKTLKVGHHAEEKMHI